MGKHWPWLPRIISSSLWVAMCSVALLTTTLAHAQQPLQLLHQHVRPAITDGRAAPVGYLPADEPLNLVIHLPVRNPQELTSLIDRLSDPASPDYHQWLSVAQFTERFGRTEAEYQKVADFAAGNGFIVTYTSPNRLMLVVRASVAQIERALNVTMRTYQHPTEDRIFYSPDREPSIALDVPVSHISGLNNYSYPHPAAGPRPAELPQPSGTGSGPGSSFLGSDMRGRLQHGLQHRRGPDRRARRVLRLHRQRYQPILFQYPSDQQRSHRQHRCGRRLRQPMERRER